MSYITQQQWQEFDSQGYLRLGKPGTDAMVCAMRQRIDEIMLGEADLDYDRMLMQLDSSDGTYDAAGAQTRGHKGRTLNYRKIQLLERDPIFLEYMQLPVFAEAASHFYGDKPVAAFRAMFMNKPAGRGTFLPLHQDRWRALDRDPLLTIYIALDAANEENGCMEIIPGTQHTLLNPDHPSGFLTAEMARDFDHHPRRKPLVLEAGEAVLMHPWMLHGSGVNRSDRPRRAFSVCLMDADTMSLRYNRLASRSIIFGEGAME
ncbi:MAG: phytanoyl-CoA dioxygenase family protein [Gammaproteobacteria bacterium]|nr:phytanoyl-CoA dioxygenase family protein [Gammaproteobacteria bacterium]